MYWVDIQPEHGPRLMRARGEGSTGSGPHDDRWVALTRLISGLTLESSGVEVPGDEIDPSDKRPWMLRVGSRHSYDFHVPGGMFDTTDYWWTQRVATEIRRFDGLPPEGEWTIAERVPRPGRQA